MGNTANNFKTNNCNTCTKPQTNVTDKVAKDMAKEITKASEALGVSAEDIITKLIAELKLNFSIGDIDTTIKTGDVEVPLFSGNTINITIGDVTVAERGGRIKNKKKGGKKNKK